MSVVQRVGQLGNLVRCTSVGVGGLDLLGMESERSGR